MEKARWEYLGTNSLFIDKGKVSYLFKLGFFDENILALKVDSSNEYAVFVNENKYNEDLNSIDKIAAFLKNEYLISDYIKPKIKKINESNKFWNDDIMLIIIFSAIISITVIVCATTDDSLPQASVAFHVFVLV